MTFSGGDFSDEGTRMRAVPKEDHRNRAMKCMQLAEQVTDPSLRTSLLDEAHASLRRYDRALDNRAQFAPRAMLLVLAP
jgi:hypothetical protein